MAALKAAAQTPEIEPTPDEDSLARRIQGNLQPAGAPLIEGLDMAGLSLPASSAGGDYYDFLPSADDLVSVAIGECGGRGIAPAMVMASARAYVRVLATTTNDVAEILSRTNQLVTEDIGDEEFLVTLLVAQFDQLTRTLHFASAGHQAHLIDREGLTHTLQSTGMPIGLRADTVIPEGEPRRFRQGDILLLTTDGAWKMTSPSGERFGTARILDVIRQNRHLPARMIVSFIHNALTEFSAAQAPSDDITLVVIKGDQAASG